MCAVDRDRAKLLPNTCSVEMEEVRCWFRLEDRPDVCLTLRKAGSSGQMHYIVPGQTGLIK